MVTGLYWRKVFNFARIDGLAAISFALLAQPNRLRFEQSLSALRASCIYPRRGAKWGV